MEENFLNKRPENSAVEIDDDAAVHKLRLLAVDAQIFSLQYLSVVLHKCNYKVKATTSAAEALEILGANKNEFDVVLVDVDSANIKGFKLLEIIGLEMYIPVIMVTGDGSLENIIKGLNYGAVDYIIKPVGVQEIKDAIWHCVAPNNTDWGSQQSTDTHESSDHQNVKPSEHSDASFTVEDDKHNTPLDDASSSCQRKKRMVWTPELDAKFVRAVQTLSKGSMVHPKRILEIMKEPGLTRAKVASHLQKYRMSLKKQQSFDIESVTRFSSTKRTNRRYGKAGDVNADPVAVPSFNPFNSLEDIMLVDPEKPYQSVPYSCLDDLNFQTPDFKSFNYYNYCLGMNIQPHNLGSEPLPGITSRPPYFHDVGSEASSPSSAPFYPSSNAFLAPETDVPFQSSFAVASVPNRFPVKRSWTTGQSTNLGNLLLSAARRLL
ncbi:two-component response regulator ARR12-like [Herrania umbratica]|uniref:Two-component response regulator ARR12-like n=1 Tax=Herrania umbratica TaxID=108875 RepID=A0A6J1BCE7_9ROSI|nr:two-component response regulator ARR12-like [Herrania umbratica]